MSGIKSRVICDDLLRRITSGDLSGALMLPAEGKLAESYACSRPTVRKALAGLREAGYITGAKGSGSYITRPARFQRKDNAETFLGIIFPNMGPEYFFDILCNNLARHASENGYSLVYGGYLSPKSEMLKPDIMRICDRYITQKIKGVFFAPFGYHPKSDQINKEIIYSFSGAGIPVVLLDSDIERYPRPNNFDLVSLNHIQAGYVITEHLIERNARRLFFLAPPNSHLSVKLRFIGCRAAMTGAAGEAISQIAQKALGLNGGGKIAICRHKEHLSVCIFMSIGLLYLKDVVIGLGHRSLPSD